jgi:hypothetical protein
MIIQTIVGSVPLQVPMNNYCSEECVDKYTEKNKPTSA